MTEAKPFFNSRNELAVVNGIISKGPRVVIPKSMQQSIKPKLHERLLGIVLTQLQARNCIHWIKIDSEIVDMISSCPSCIQYQNKQQKESLIQHDISKQVWTKVGTHILSALIQDLVILEDYTSKYFEIFFLPNALSDAAINHTNSIFARHGILETVISDNGPQFISDEYDKSAKSWESYHNFSSSEYPESNGMVEQTIQTVKKTLRKAELTNNDPYFAILAFRTTHKNLLPLNQGQSIRSHQDKSWSRKDIIIESDIRRKSYKILTDKNTVIPRNRQHILKSNETFKLDLENTDLSFANENKQCLLKLFSLDSLNNLAEHQSKSHQLVPEYQPISQQLVVDPQPIFRQSAPDEITSNETVVRRARRGRITKIPSRYK